ncbi:MAG TPA: proprotein convertase P-domain-containing protein, partial [Gemmataceae bacterium]|nr:proprotein convertase P-domain-containing protein [Gemmataceae bacterium]
DLAAALADLPPPVSVTHPTITGTIASKPSLGQFYKVRVLFSEAIDPRSFTAADVALTGPNGPVAITGVGAVDGAGNTQFDVTFVTQTTPGAYRLSVGPHVQDAGGNEMTQAYAVTFTVRGGTTKFASGALSQPVLDFRTTTSTITVGQDGPVGRLTVSVNVTHTWVGDLVVKLRGPDGTTVTLFNRRGGSGHNLHATFDDAAATALANGKAPYNGPFRPEQSLGAFAGKNARGAWQLIVQDQAAGDQGTLTSWSFTIQAGSGSSSLARPSSLNATSPAPIPGSSHEVDTIFADSQVAWEHASSRAEAPSIGSLSSDSDRRPIADFVVPRSPDRVIDGAFACGAGSSDGSAKGLDEFAFDRGAPSGDALSDNPLTLTASR